jgi:hypothetical protein
VKELGDNTVRPESEEDKDISGFGPIRGLTAYW